MKWNSTEQFTMGNVLSPFHFEIILVCTEQLYEWDRTNETERKFRSQLSQYYILPITKLQLSDQLNSGKNENIRNKDMKATCFRRSMIIFMRSNSGFLPSNLGSIQEDRFKVEQFHFFIEQFLNLWNSVPKMWNSSPKSGTCSVSGSQFHKLWNRGPNWTCQNF